MAASAATAAISSNNNWPYPSSSTTNTGASMSPLRAGQALAGTLSPPGTAASLSSTTTTSSSSGAPGSHSSATSPSLGDLGNTLHSTFSSLSLNSGSTPQSSLNTASNAKSPSSSDYARPSPMRTPSATSLQQSHYLQQQQQQPTVQISAIGSGRSGTSPPSRAGNLDSLNGSSSIVGSPSSNTALSPSASMSQQLPPPQRHTPSHSLPWPTYANGNGGNLNGNGTDSLAFLSGTQQSQSQREMSSMNGIYGTRNSIDGNSHFSSTFQQQHQQQPQQQYYQQQQRSRQHTNSDNSSSRSHQSQYHQQQQQYRQDHKSSSDLSNRIDDNDHNNNNSSNVNDSAARFALSSSSSTSQQPQFNLDHAQLAKSREQKDLDDIDSGQRASATLWMGDLEGWMDEGYIKKCITALGWDREIDPSSSTTSTSTSSSTSSASGAAGAQGQPSGTTGGNIVQTSVKMIKGASSTSGYCFITFPTSSHAQAVLAHFSKQPPMLMPGSERTFKLNWATGLPGVQPKWEGEYSIFVGDLGREVTEGELVALFTPLFQSTKSAKIMYDPSTGLSRGYGFVRFGDENDMTRSLALGQNNSGSGLSLRGRTLRISEASGSGGSRNRTQSGEGEIGGNISSNNTGKNTRDLHIKVPNNGLAGANLLGPNASGFSIPVASPTSPGLTSPPYSAHNHGSNNGSSGHVTPLSPSSDPTNTTVFVGGLPACIGEETLRSFFQHFGEITYAKIPPNKGCGFVQFVRRPDAELAIAKMHDFPIHGKSRIRLSWGRSQGDKQVEHVRKLANALNVPFEAVWRMVQGQDNSTIKQIASAVGGNTNQARGGAAASTPRNGTGIPNLADPENARAGLARLASLRNSVGPGAGPAGGPFGDAIPRGAIYDGMQGMPALAPPSIPGQQAHGQFGPHDPEAYAFRPAVPAVLSPAEFGFAGPPRANDAGPYSRVSPSAFAPLSTSNLAGQPQQSMPLSPPTSGGAYTHQQEHQHHQHQHTAGGYGGSFDPYTPVSIPSPVGNGSAHMQGNSNSGGLDPSSNFGPRSWRQQQHAEMSAPSPSFQSGLPEFLTSSMNGRF